MLNNTTLETKLSEPREVVKHLEEKGVSAKIAQRIVTYRCPSNSIEDVQYIIDIGRGEYSSFLTFHQLPRPYRMELFGPTSDEEMDDWQYIAECLESVAINPEYKTDLNRVRRCHNRFSWGLLILKIGVFILFISFIFLASYGLYTILMG